MLLGSLAGIKMSWPDAYALPAMRQQFVDEPHFVRGQARQDILQVLVWIEPVELGRLDQAHHCGRALLRPQRARNNQFERPRAIGRIWLSTQLLPTSRSPSSM